MPPAVLPRAATVSTWHSWLLLTVMATTCAVQVIIEDAPVRLKVKDWHPHYTVLASGPVACVIALIASSLTYQLSGMKPVPGWLFPPLFVAGIAILLAGGVQWQVGRKQRTNFNDQAYIEDSSLGNSTRYRVLVGKDDTAGEYFTIEVLIRAEAYGFIRDKPGSEVSHLHLHQEERIKVKQGKLGYFIGHQTHVQAAEAEEEVVIKPGESHMLFNAGGGSNGTDLLLEITFTPARHGEQLYETLAGLGHDYESVLAVSPLQKWTTFSEAEVVPSEVPPATWAAIEAYLVPMAKKLGYQPFYQEYKTKRHFSRRTGSFEEEEEGDDEE